MRMVPVNPPSNSEYGEEATEKVAEEDLGAEIVDMLGEESFEVDGETNDGESLPSHEKET